MFRAPRLVQYVFLALLIPVIVFAAGCRGVVPGANLQEASAAAPPTVTFNASPDTVSMGSQSTLSWKATGAVSANIDSIGNVPTQGTHVVTPTATTTYKLTAT